MTKINTKALLKILEGIDKNNPKPAYSNLEILNELQNILADTGQAIQRLTEEQAIKMILWQGILNQYGIYGNKKGSDRKFYKKNPLTGDTEETTYASKSFSRGKVLSIDFGTSNIDYEFSLTHTGIVIADYPNLVVVIPVTSQSDTKYDSLPEKIKEAMVPIAKSDYPLFENDSYALLHHIRSVSKNRITKIIGSISKTKLMDQLEQKLYEQHSVFIKKKNDEKIKELECKIQELENKNEELRKEILQKNEKELEKGNKNLN